MVVKVIDAKRRDALLFHFGDMLVCNSSLSPAAWPGTENAGRAVSDSES